MRLGGEPESSNFEDRTGQRGFGFGGGGGGNALGCLIPLIMSRFGVVGVVILLLGYCALTQFGGGGGILPSGTPQQQQQSLPAGQSTLSPETRSFLTHVLGSTEQTWGEIFAKNGRQYVPTTMVAYSSSTSSGCGMAQSAGGPIYCPTHQKN
jgi:predicted metalloprotease